MSVRDRKTRTIAPSKPQQQLNFAVPEPVAADGSFHATLSHCAAVAKGQSLPVQCSSAVLLVKGRAWQGRCSDLLQRAWSTLCTRYKTSTTKRLHLSETISLGEKRFVAIVNVEGREFLIGGGVSGMSLLAQLGAAPGSTCEPGPQIGNSGGIA